MSAKPPSPVTSTVTLIRGRDNTVTLYDTDGHRIQLWQGQVSVYHNDKKIDDSNVPALKALIERLEQDVSPWANIANFGRRVFNAPMQFEVNYDMLSRLAAPRVPQIAEAKPYTGKI